MASWKHLAHSASLWRGGTAQQREGDTRKQGPDATWAPRKGLPVTENLSSSCPGHETHGCSAEPFSPPTGHWTVPPASALSPSWEAERLLSPPAPE